MKKIGKALKYIQFVFRALSISTRIDVPSWDKFATYIEAWDDFKKRNSGKDNNNDEGTKVNPQTESQIIGKIIDSICNDGESSDEEENNNPAQEKEGETRDQLGEESDGGNDTDALVKGLGFSRAEFLKKWKQISNATHDSVEWRQSHPNVSSKSQIHDQLTLT
ncbi:hypothetical protein C0993_009513 [Termitomyces sp. T159_Od127]|nr:hypothetical protein C0993_009513 [Termitomyces sp. T159_Od127]